MIIVKVRLPAALVLVVVLSGCFHSERAKRLRRKAENYAAKAVLAAPVALVKLAVERDPPERPAPEALPTRPPGPSQPRPEGIASSPVPYQVPLAGMHDAVTAELVALGCAILEDEAEDPVFLITARSREGNVLVTHHLHGEAAGERNATLQFVANTDAQFDPDLTLASRAHQTLRRRIGAKLAELEWKSTPDPTSH